MKSIRICFLFLAFFFISTACTRPQPSVVATKTNSDSGITILDSNVGDVDWSRDGKTLAYTKRATDGYFDIWTSKPDGSAKQCLTCGNNFSRRHRGGVTQRPQGDYLAFVAENDGVRGDAESLAIPGTGMNTNLWVMKSDGSQSWKLTDLPMDTRTPRGIIHPQFSRDGKRLVWAEALGKSVPTLDQVWGEWSIAIADFVIAEGNTPTVKNIRRVQPGDQRAFYETHDWSSNNRAILFSGNLKRGQAVNANDIYEYDIATEQLTPLTDSFDDWDEHAHYAPDGETIAWMSGADLHVAFPDVRGLAWQQYVETELWLMDRDGSNQQRATFFNQPGTSDYDWFQQNIYKTDRVVVADNAFSPDGKKILVNLAYEGAASPQFGNIRSVLVLLDLEKRKANGTGGRAGTVPDDYRALYQELDKRLDEFATRLNAQSKIEPRPTIFAAELLPANSNRGPELLTDRAYQGVLVYLDQLQAIGVRGVKVAIGYPLLSAEFPRAREYVAFYKKLAQELKRRKMTLLVGAGIIFSDSAFSDLHVDYSGLSLEKYKQLKRQHVETIIKEIQPDYVTIANEPSTEAKITKLPITLSSFVEQVNYILSTVDHRGVLIGAGAGNWDDAAYIENLAKNTRVDYIDLHVYPVNREFLPRALQFAEMARANGKRVIVGETWLYKAGEREVGGADAADIIARDVFSFWQPLDAKYLTVMTQFARQNQVEFISLFWSKYFFAYLNYDTTRQGLSPKQLLQLADTAASEQIVTGNLSETGQTYRRLIAPK